LDQDASLLWAQSTTHLTKLVLPAESYHRRRGKHGSLKEPKEERKKRGQKEVGAARE
jgi:hypothetical protein